MRVAIILLPFFFDTSVRVAACLVDKAHVFFSGSRENNNGGGKVTDDPLIPSIHPNLPRP